MIKYDYSLHMVLAKMRRHINLLVAIRGQWRRWRWRGGWRGGGFEGQVAVDDEVEDLAGGGKGAVGGQEHVDEGGLQLPRVRGEGLHQAFQSPGLEEPDPHRLPFQVRDLIVIVLLQDEETRVALLPVIMISFILILPWILSLLFPFPITFTSLSSTFFPFLPHLHILHVSFHFPGPPFSLFSLSSFVIMPQFELQSCIYFIYFLSSSLLYLFPRSYILKFKKCMIVFLILL